MKSSNARVFFTEYAKVIILCKVWLHLTDIFTYGWMTQQKINGKQRASLRRRVHAACFVQSVKQEGNRGATWKCVRGSLARARGVRRWVELKGAQRESGGTMGSWQREVNWRVNSPKTKCRDCAPGCLCAVTWTPPCQCRRVIDWVFNLTAVPWRHARVSAASTALALLLCILLDFIGL